MREFFSFFVYGHDYLKVIYVFLNKCISVINLLLLKEKFVLDFIYFILLLFIVIVISIKIVIVIFIVIVFYFHYI